MCFVEQLLGNFPPELLIGKDIASYLGWKETLPTELWRKVNIHFEEILGVNINSIRRNYDLRTCG
jgi:hypothetical protein